MKRFSPIIREQINWWMWQNNLQSVHRELNDLVRHFTYVWLTKNYNKEHNYYLRVLGVLQFTNREEVTFKNIIRTFLATNLDTKLNFNALKALYQEKNFKYNYSYEDMLTEIMEIYNNPKDNLFFMNLCRNACVEWKLKNFISFMHTKRENIYIFYSQTPHVL